MGLTKFNGMNPKGSAWNPSLEVLLTPTLQVVDTKMMLLVPSMES